MNKTIDINGWDIVTNNAKLNFYSSEKESIVTHSSEICLTVAPTAGPGAEEMVDIKIGDITLSISGNPKVINVFYK